MKRTNCFSNMMMKSVLVLTVAVFALLIMVSKAGADAIDYLSNNYTGTVTRDDGATMYKQPGSINPKVTDADGNPVLVPYGTEVFITGEEFDHELDVWYKVKCTVNGVEYEGYLYTERVTRGDAVPFTPTPTPEPTPTPDVATGSLGNPNVPQITGDADVDDTTKDMVDKAGTFEPWKWIIALVIVILIFMICYTAWVKISEEKLEKEIERYSNRPQYTPLEGELEEDFEEAKANYYDHIGLGDQSNRDLGELIGNPEEVHLDMSGMFEEEEPEPVVKPTNSFAEDESLKSLIASLEEKLGQSSFEETAEEEVVPELTEVQPEEEFFVNTEFEEPEEVEEEIKVPEFINTNAQRTGRIPAPVKTQAPVNSYADTGISAMFEEEEEDVEEFFDVRDMLDNLNDGDILIHKSYGEGIVEDNSDSEIIQVRFGEDVRYFKKDKLVKKNLIQF